MRVRFLYFYNKNVLFPSSTGVRSHNSPFWANVLADISPIYGSDAIWTITNTFPNDKFGQTKTNKPVVKSSVEPTNDWLTKLNNS